MEVSPSVPENTATPDAPLASVAMAVVGGVLLGASGRGRASSLLRLAGIALVARALEPVFDHAVRDASARRRNLSTHTALDVDRPVAEVFAFFKDFENFPRVSDGLKCVEDHQDGRSHWEAYTPSGTVIEWDAVVTKYVPNVVLAWRSVPGSPVDMSGLIRFTPLSPMRTHLEMDLTYARASGDARLKDALQSFVAPKPARKLEETLRRTRLYLESSPPDGR